MMGLLRRAAKVRRAMRTPLYRNSFYLLASAAVSNGGGFLFWLIAARNFPDAIVGVAVALSATLLYLSSAATLGLGIGLVRFLPVEHSQIRLINHAMTLSGAMALGLGLIFLVGVDVWAPSLAFERTDPGFLAIILASMLGFTLGFIIDDALLAVRRADYGFLRQGLYNFLRLPLPFVFAAMGGVVAIGVAWTVPLLLSAVIGGLALLPRAIPGYRPKIVSHSASHNRILGYSLGNHAAVILSNASISLLPLLVANTLPQPQGAEGAAYFYAALALAGLLFVVPVAFSSSLFVEGSHATTHYAADTRRTARASLALLALGIVMALLLGPGILGFFGPRYSTEGYPAFLVLAATSPLVLANSLFVTHLRVVRRILPLVGVTLASATVTLVLAYYLLPIMGIVGASAGFAIGQAAGLMLFAIHRRIERSRSSVIPDNSEH